MFEPCFAKVHNVKLGTVWALINMLQYVIVSNLSSNQGMRMLAVKRDTVRLRLQKVERAETHIFIVA